METASLPDVKLDLTTSTLLLAGETFAASALVAPNGEVWGGPEYKDTPEQGWYAYIMLKNGAAMNVELVANDRRRLNELTFSLWLVYPALDGAPTDDACPLKMALRDGRIVRAGIRDTTGWTGAHPDWALEHILRLNKKPIEAPIGFPTMTPVEIAKAW